MRSVTRIATHIKLTLFLYGFGICLLLMGCGGSSANRAKLAKHSDVAVVEKKEDLAMADFAADGGNIQPQNTGKSVQTVIRKIISTSRIELISDNFNTDKEKIEGLITDLNLPKSGGYLSQREINGSAGSQRYGLWVVRLNIDSVDAFLKDVATVAELIKADSGSNDVTDQYVDLQARVKNKQQEEIRLLSHLEKSAVLQDTLALEKELSRVREEIERLQGQLNVLTSATDLATVHVQLRERTRYVPPPTLAPIAFPVAVSRAFMESYQNLIGFLQDCTIAVAAVSPWAIAAFLVTAPVLLIRRLVRRRRQTRPA